MIKTASSRSSDVIIVWGTNSQDYMLKWYMCDVEHEILLEFYGILRNNYLCFAQEHTCSKQHVK